MMNLHATSLLALLVTAVILVVGDTYPSGNYYLASHCEFNPGALVNKGRHDPCVSLSYNQCNKRMECWWRDTTAQNALWNHTLETNLGQVLVPYTSDQVTVYVYNSKNQIANSIAIVSGTIWMLVGCGGSTAAATEARAAFINAIPNFASLTLKAVVMTHSHADHLWGCPIWTNSSAAIGVFAPTGFVATLQTQMNQKQILTWRGSHQFGYELEWGSDAYLGGGAGARYTSTYPQPWSLPNRPVISANTNVTVGSTIVTFIPASGESDDQMAVYLPNHGVLIPADAVYKSLVNGYTPRGTTPRPILTWIATLDKLRALKASVLIPEHTIPLIGQAAIMDAFIAERDALQYLHDETVREMNTLINLEDIVANVSLPQPLASHPFVQPFYGYTPFIVRAIYDYYLGWFNGEAYAMEFFSRSEEAQRLVALGGGRTSTLRAARDAIVEHTRSGALWALKLSAALRIVYPCDDANTIYIQALKMLGWTIPTATGRNWYLETALLAEEEIDASSKRDSAILKAERASYDTLYDEIMFLMPSLPIRLHTDLSTGVTAAFYIRFTDLESYTEWFVAVRGPVAEVHESEIMPDIEYTVVDCTSTQFQSAIHGNHVFEFSDEFNDFIALFAS